jgi:hypothetical protein
MTESTTHAGPLSFPGGQSHYATSTTLLAGARFCGSLLGRKENIMGQES